MKNLTSRPDSLCSIDASTNSLAFAYFENNQLIKYGKIKYFGNDIYEKIIDVSHKTKSFFDNFNYLDHVVIEQVVYLNSPKTAANLAMSHGAICSSLGASGAKKIKSVSPMQWQNAIGNKRLTAEEKQKIRSSVLGKSESWYKSQERLYRKQKTIKFVNEKYNLKINDDDVADAIAIGVFSLENWNKIFSQ
jgi:Holliday junction resolvasome RuvABC endonuclease subunit